MIGTIVFSIPSAIKWTTFNLQAWYLPALSFLITLFILALACIAWMKKMNKMLKRGNFAEIYASKVRLRSFDGAWNAEYNGTTSVAIHQISVKCSYFFTHCDNIWQTIVSDSYLCQIKTNLFALQ